MQRFCLDTLRNTYGSSLFSVVMEYEPLKNSTTTIRNIYSMLKNGNRALLALLGLLALLFLVSLWVLRPAYQPLWYAIRYELIGVIAYLVLAGTVFVSGRKILSQNRRAGKVLIYLSVVLVILAVMMIPLGDIERNETLSERTTTATTTQNIETLGNETMIDETNARILTLRGAETQAETSFNDPSHRLTDGELVLQENQLSTSSAIVPEGLYRTFTKQQEGAVLVNINSNKPTVTKTNESFECGRGMAYFDNVHYQIQKDNMNTKLTNPTTFVGNDGNAYNMFSGIQHTVKISFEKGIPIPYAVPELNSVHLADTDCNTERLTPEEAVNDSRMDGQNAQQFYPYSLMRQEVLATNLQYGYINTITSSEGMKELPDTPSIDNEPPYTLIGPDGNYMQVLAMEAIGDGTGIFEIYVGDGRTGEKTKYTFDSTTKGPQYAVDATITADAEKFGAGEQKLTVSEVYPVFRNGNLWYQINAVQSNTGVYGFTTFYNPETGDLLKAFNDAQITAFYNGNNETHTRDENVIDSGNQTGSERNIQNPSLWITLTNSETGETYRIPVSNAETISVQQEQETTNTTTTE